MVSPCHHPLLTVYAYQVSLIGSHQHALRGFTERCDAELLREQVLAVAEVQPINLLVLGIEEYKAIIVGLDPEILLRVDVQHLGTALDTLFRQPDGR